MSRWLLALLFAFGSVTLITGCEEKSDVEKAGDEVEEGLEEGGEAAGEALEDAGDALEDATN